MSDGQNTMLLLRLILTPVLLLLGLWLTYSAAGALRNGEANAAGTRVRWNESPAFFVITVLVQFGFGALALWQATLILLALIQGHLQ